jgi:hypothetical protein
MFSFKLTVAGAAALQLLTGHVALWNLAYKYSSFTVQLSVIANSTPPPPVHPGSLPPPNGDAAVQAFTSVKAAPPVA